MRIALLTSFLFFLLTTACKKDKTPEFHENTEESEVDPWVGTYNGDSYHWVSHAINGVGWQTTGENKTVSAVVQKNPSGSDYDLLIEYGDSTGENWTHLNFSSDGEYLIQGGGGSGYGYLRINLRNDSLLFDYFAKCGMNCSSGREFQLKKQ